MGLVKPIAAMIPESRLHTRSDRHRARGAGLLHRRAGGAGVSRPSSAPRSRRRCSTRSLAIPCSARPPGDARGQGADLEMALVEMEGRPAVGVVVERHDMGWVTVFIPLAPRPRRRERCLIFPAAKVHPVDVPFGTGPRRQPATDGAPARCSPGLGDRAIPRRRDTPADHEEFPATLAAAVVCLLFGTKSRANARAIGTGASVPPPAAQIFVVGRVVSFERVSIDQSAIERTMERIRLHRSHPRHVIFPLMRACFAIEKVGEGHADASSVCSEHGFVGGDCGFSSQGRKPLPRVRMSSGLSWELRPRDGDLRRFKELS